MILPKKIRAEIADRTIRIVAPVVTVALTLLLLIVLLFSDQQYHRLIPTLIGIAIVIPPWVLARKGKPLTGIVFLISGFSLAIISGMIFSGGIQSLAYVFTLVLMTLLLVLYGTRGGIAFAVITLVLGGLFIKLDTMGILPQVNEPPPVFLLMNHGIFLLLAFFFVSVPVHLMFKALSDSERQSDELRQAVRQRKSVEARLQSILDKTPDIIYRLDPEGRISFVNEAITKYGYRSENVIGKPMMDFIHPDDKPFVERKILERRTGERGAQNTEVRILTGEMDSDKGSGQVFKETSVMFQVYSDGIYSGETLSPETYSGVQGVARDISKTRHFEQQIDQLVAVVEQAAEDVVITDPAGVIKYVNPKFEEVTGYSREDVIGKTPKMLKSGKHDKAFYKNLWKKLKNGEDWKGHMWNKKKDGSTILQDVTITPIIDASSKLTGYASVRRDITEQQKIQEQLQQSQKMEAIGTLAGGIAHDFNNILTGIMGYTELAMADVKDMSSTRRKLDKVLQASHRATDLVRQILSFSRSQKSELNTFKPVTIIKEVLTFMRASLPATIEIKQSLNSTGYIHADAGSIHRVLMNLCTNAAHAMQTSGGVLSVSLHDEMLKEEDLTMYPEVSPGDFVKISVADTGVGMTREVQKKAFDPFFTTKETGVGTGMGLSTVHGAIVALDGFISLYSEPGQGTTINVFIPLVSKNTEADRSLADKPLVGGKERILFVDDEEIQTELSKEVLSRYGYQVTTFSDSAVALAHFQQNPDEYDLVITDMTMPTMTGDILIQKIHLERSDIPVILCTGFSESIDEEKSRGLGINAFLYKPILSANLLVTIREVIDKVKN